VPEPPPLTDASSESIGPYRLLRELGRGGQGIVYLAEDTRLKRRVALKILRATGSVSNDALARFRREAEAASRLEHPGICAVHEAALDGNVPYIAMRFVEGESLAQKLTAAHGSHPLEPSAVSLPEVASAEAAAHADDVTQTPSGPTSRAEVMRVVRVIEQAARALHAAHAAGVIHRDVKPGNIMVTPDGDAVVMDFGLAHLEEPDQHSLTQTGDFFGTPAYMSPEQLLAQRVRLDPRTDVWSLGVTLYECLTLRRPFEAPTREGVYHSIQTRNPPDPRRLNPGIPDDLRVVLECALEKDRDRRYQTALDFAEDLRRVREYQPITARPVSAATRLLRWAQRNPALAASVFGLFLALTAGLVISLSLLFDRDAALAEKSNALSEKDRALVDRVAAMNELKTALSEKDGLLRRSEGLRLITKASGELAWDAGLSLALALEGADLAPEAHGAANQVAREALEALGLFKTAVTHAESVSSCRFRPGGQEAVTISDWDGSARVWDLSRGTELWRFDGPPRAHWAVSPDGRWLAIAERAPGLWDGGRNRASTGAERPRPESRGAPVAVRIVDVDRRMEAGSLVLDGQDTARCQFTTADRLLVFRRTDNRPSCTEIWDFQAGRMIRRWSASERVYVSLDGQVVGQLGRESSLSLIHAGTGVSIPTDPIVASPPIALSQDARLVATMRGQDTIRLYDRRLRLQWQAGVDGRLREPTPFSYSPNGRCLLALLASVGPALDKQALTKGPGFRIFETASGRRIDPGTASPELDDAVFSPDGQRLLTYSWKLEAISQLWESASGVCLWNIPARADRISDAAFSPDGESILFAVGRGCELLPIDAVAFASRLPTRELTLAECERHDIGSRADLDAVHRLFDEPIPNEDLVRAIESLGPINRRLRAAALASAMSRDGQLIAESRGISGASVLQATAWQLAQAPASSRGDRLRAFRLADRAARLEPASPLVLTTLGMALYRVERYADALEALQKADVKGASHAATRLLLAGMAHWKLGKREEARGLIGLGVTAMAQTDGGPIHPGILKEAMELVDAKRPESRPETR
jgi:serine/threonine protein kinase